MFVYTVEMKRRKWAKFVCRATLVAGVLYLVLLIPERKAAVGHRAGKQPFVWKQDPLWSELEHQFNDARSLGCEKLASRIEAGLAELRRLLDESSGRSLPPDDPSFVSIETAFFKLAPMLGACPQRFQDYAALANRARAEVKKQSEHWDLNSTLGRQTIYRLLFGGRMALEEVMLQAPSAAVLPQVAGDDEPSMTPAARILGMAVHSGDILVSRGGAPTSALIARGNDYPGSFSHIALVHVDEKSGQASVIESHIERGVAVASFDEYLRDKKLRIMVLRLRADLAAMRADPMLPHKAAMAALAESKRRHIPYDFAMDCQDHRAQFCSEVVSAAYEETGLKLWNGTTFISSPGVTAWLGSFGVRHFETQEPADLEYDSQVRVVAEWRDQTTLLRAHVDDAVIDVMLEDANPAGALAYSKLLLPVTRIAKGYSVVLNLLGKIGPVPEGMSATTALRVKKYRHDHAVLAERVLALAEEFKKSKGYTPPYWELIKLATRARQG